jgi:hypothetical protein
MQNGHRASRTCHSPRNAQRDDTDPHSARTLGALLDVSGNPENKAACTDERHLRLWEPAIPNRIQRRKIDTTKLVYLRHRQLVCECMVSGFAPRSGMKTARMANATNPKSAIGLAKCGGRLPSRASSSLRSSIYTAHGANWAARGRPVSQRRGVCITDRRTTRPPDRAPPAGTDPGR